MTIEDNSYAYMMGRKKILGKCRGKAEKKNEKELPTLTL